MIGLDIAAVLGLIILGIGVLLGAAREELAKRRRQEANRKRVLTAARDRLEELRLDGPEAYVSVAEADAYYRQEERVRLELGILGVLPPFPPSHLNCRCTLAPLEAYTKDVDRSIMRHTLDLGIPAEALDEMLTDVGRRIRRDLLDGLEPSELEVNRILKELERLSSE